jgi:hypothetical protein
MKLTLARALVCVLAVSLLPLDLVYAAPNDAEIHAYTNDSCMIADEPYLMPPTQPGDPADQNTTRFFPLIGLVVGKLAEMIITHESNAASGHIRSGARRKDTRYSESKQMNLYRAEYQPEPAVRLNAKLGCMTIVAAKLKPESTNCSADYVPKQLTRETMKLPESQWKGSRTDDSIENQLRRANICVDGKARAVYEARFEFSEDGTAYRLKNAGYHIDSLLTTQDKGATRSSFYMLEISQPSATEQRETLSTAWVRLGTISAGAHGAASDHDSPPWLRVPALTTEARRAYEQKTNVYQQVMGEIDALKRALTRNQRELTGLDQRIAAASGDVAAGLSQERTRLAVQIQTQQAELDATNAEYQDLPQTPLEFMPVTIEVAVTESESEKTAQMELASAVDFAGAQLASATTTASANIKSFDMTDHGAPSDPAAELASTRARYFDALVAVKTGGAGASGEDAKRNLADARIKYNDARRALGLEPVE